MGTELLRAGLKPEDLAESWNFTHAEQVESVHRSYCVAGAECLLTNTFQASPVRSANAKTRLDWSATYQTALRIARKAATPDTFVLASVGPFEAGIWPARGLVRRLVDSVRSADAILFETFSDPKVLDVVEHASPALSLESAAPPVLLSIAFERTAGGRIRSRTADMPEQFARWAKKRGVAGLGVNCGREIGMDDVKTIIRRYRQVTDLPLFVRPNAGTPQKSEAGWVYPHSPAAMVEQLPELLATGIAMIGGCCGTTPAHIAAFKPIVDEWNRTHGVPESK